MDGFLPVCCVHHSEAPRREELIEARPDIEVVIDNQNDLLHMSPVQLDPTRHRKTSSCNSTAPRHALWEDDNQRAVHHRTVFVLVGRCSIGSLEWAAPTIREV